MKESGEISYDSKGYFKALRKGPIDTSLLKRVEKRQRTRAVLADLHKWMWDQLLHVVDCQATWLGHRLLQLVLPHAETGVLPNRGGICLSDRCLLSSFWG